MAACRARVPRCPPGARWSQPTRAREGLRLHAEPCQTRCGEAAPSEEPLETRSLEPKHGEGATEPVRLHTAGLPSLPLRSSPARPPRCALRSRDRAAVGGDRRPTAGDRGRAAAGDRGTTGGRLRRGGRLQELEGRQAAAGVGRWEAARTAAPGA